MPSKLPEFIWWDEFSQEHEYKCMLITWWLERKNRLDIVGVPINVKNRFQNDKALLAFFETLADSKANIWDAEIEALKNDPEFSYPHLTHFKVMNRLSSWREFGESLLEDTDTNTA